MAGGVRTIHEERAHTVNPPAKTRLPGGFPGRCPRGPLRIFPCHFKELEYAVKAVYDRYAVFLRYGRVLEDGLAAEEVDHQRDIPVALLHLADVAPVEG